MMRTLFGCIAVASLLSISCGARASSVTSLPDPAADDRPPGSPAELPREFVDIPTASNSIARTLGEGDDLQSAIDTAKPGDVIALQAGATFKGSFTLRATSGSGWITIRTTTPDGVFPRPGTRVGPADARQMPVIEANKDLAITTDPGAHHYRFIGVEIRPPAGTFIYNLVFLGDGAKTFEELPHHIIFDRCYIHGDPNAGGRRGIALNARHAAVIDSYLSDFKENGSDSQAIAAWNGAGPFAIIDNYLEAAGENVMFGGGDPDVINLVPSDIEIRNNDLVKPVAWRSTSWSVKNLFELKNARRVLIDHNVFQNNWLNAQNGYAILFTPRNQEGNSPWSMVRDVTLTHNTVRHSGSGVNILGTDDIHPSQQTKRIAIRDNLFEDIDGDHWGGAGRLFQILSGCADVVIEHNTAFGTGEVIMAEGDPNSGFIYRDNLTPNNQYGVAGDNTTGQPLETLSRYFPGASFVRNVLIGGRPEAYPPNNFFPATVADVKFEDAAAGDYRLAIDSPFKDAGTDGRDIGANFDTATPARRRAVH